MALTCLQTPVSTAGSVSIRKPGFTPVPSSRPPPLFADSSSSSARATWRSHGYTSSSQVLTTAFPRESSSRNVGAHAARSELVVTRAQSIWSQFSTTLSAGRIFNLGSALGTISLSGLPARFGATSTAATTLPTPRSISSPSIRWPSGPTPTCRIRFMRERIRPHGAGRHWISTALPERRVQPALRGLQTGLRVIPPDVEPVHDDGCLDGTPRRLQQPETRLSWQSGDGADDPRGPVAQLVVGSPHIHHEVLIDTPGPDHQSGRDRVQGELGRGAGLHAC